MTAARTIWHLQGHEAHRELVVTIPLRVRNPLNGSHCHWTVKAKWRREQRTTTGLVVSGHLMAAGIGAPCLVTLVRFGPTKGLDYDGLVASMKSVRDGVADALKLDDADPRVSWAYDQRRDKAWGVEIRIGRQLQQTTPKGVAAL